MTDCIFCKIIKGEIPSTNVFRDEQVTAFRDINPAAPTHILIVPNKHIDSVNTLASEDEPLIGHLFTCGKTNRCTGGNCRRRLSSHHQH